MKNKKNSLKIVLIAIVLLSCMGWCLKSTKAYNIGSSTTWPNSPTCQVIVKVSNDGGINTREYRGTAFIVDDNVAVTAAHVAFPEGRPSYFTITLIPAQDGYVAPYGIYNVLYCIHAQDRFANPSYENDWCVLVLDRHIRSSGQYPIRVFDNSPIQLNSAIGIPVCTIGYPNWNIDHQNRVDGRIERYDYMNNNLFITSLKIAPGCSGSPILDSESRVLGIVVARFDSYPLSLCRRIDRNLYNIIVDVIRNYP